MKSSILKYVRTSIIICFVTSLLYLRICGLPSDMIIVQYGDKGMPLVKTGIELVVYENGKQVEDRKILTLNGGLSAVRTVLPQLLSALLVVFGIGYALGELTRRTLSIEKVSAEAVRKAQELEDSATAKLTSFIISSRDPRVTADIVLSNRIHRP